MLAVLFLTCLAAACSAQSYAERNVVPADTFQPSSAYDVGVEEDEEDFRFLEYGDEDEGNVYKWNAEEFPHPRNQSRFCNRLKPSHVCDPDGVLAREHADFLDVSIRKMYRETKCICNDGCSSDEGGIVAGIALLKHVYMPYNLHHVKAIRSFTERLRRLWRLGRCDNDFLIVIVTVDRMYYIDVGEATSRYLSVREANEIFVKHRAWFSAGNFFEGLRDILDGYQLEILRKESRKEPEKLDIALVSGAIIGSIAILGLLLFVGFVVYRRCSRNKKHESIEKIRPNESISSSWSKKDIKVLFGSEKLKNPPPLKNPTRYEPCRQTDDLQMASQADAEEEVIDFTLATPDDTSFSNETKLNSGTSDSEVLDKDLSTATANIVKTFPSSTSHSSVLMTDM